jgi:hypothetical protein
MCDCSCKHTVDASIRSDPPLGPALDPRTGGGDHPPTGPNLPQSGPVGGPAFVIRGKHCSVSRLVALIVLIADSGGTEWTRQVTLDKRGNLSSA